MDKFSFVQTVDGLGQSIIVAVAAATDRRLNAGLSQTFAIADTDVLRAPVRMVDQRAIVLRPSGIQRLLQCIEHEVRGHGRAHAPTHDAPSVDVDDEGHVQPALPGRDVSEVRDPELVGAICAELPVDAIERATSRIVREGRAYALAAPHTLQPLDTHQALDGAARDGDTFPI